MKGWIKGIGRTLLFGKDDPLSPLSWGRRAWNFALSSGMEGVEEIAQGLISNRALGQENDCGELLYEGAGNRPRGCRKISASRSRRWGSWGRRTRSF